MLKKINTEMAPQAIGPYAQAIGVGNLIYTSGQIAIDPATENLVGDDIVSQTEQVMKNIGAVLTAAGSSYECVVKTTCFLVNMNNFAAFNKVYGKYFTDNPARSCIAVKELPKNALVEVEAIATIERGQKS